MTYLTDKEMEALNKIPHLEIRKFIELQSKYRNTFNDITYFNSDINKYINEKCYDEMTSIDLDCCQYKASIRHLRIIEYKHVGEYRKQSQLRLLKKLSNIFSLSSTNLDCQVYLLEGNPPFTDLVTVTIISNGNKFQLRKKSLRLWLEFKIPVIIRVNGEKIKGLEMIKEKLRLLHTFKL